MNSINFIKKIVPQQQLEFYKWLKISIVFFVSFMICAMIINFLQLYKISKFKKVKFQEEKALIDFEAIMKNKNNLKLQLESIQKELEKIKYAKLSNNQIVNYLEEISNSLPNETYLKSLSYNKSNGSLELKGGSLDSDLISIFIKKISKLSFLNDVKLVYLKLLTDQNVENSEQSNLEFLIRIKLSGSKL